MIRFLLNEKLVTIKDAPADLTVLNYLRERLKMAGTKEGCASGDCGACTVVLAELSGIKSNGLHYRAINSCVTFLSALHGKQLITIEHLATGKNQLHPVQQAMIDHHGSQCGFCTPGFVMSTFALYHSADSVSRDDVVHSLSGNLCRCTGYRPIIDAALDSCNQEAKDQFITNEKRTVEQLSMLAAQTDAGTQGILMPTTSKEMAEALSQNPDSRLVAGSTDLALEVTQQLFSITTLISVAAMTEMKKVSVNEQELSIGAACPINDISAIFLQYFPSLSEIVERFASLPIRNQATLGGNIANASPIGDMPPVLIALQAKVVLDKGDNQRTVPLGNFFTGYKHTVLEQGEWIHSIVIPLPSANTQIRAYKISKRNEDDISAVCAVFALTTENNKVTAIHSGFGGVAATPMSCDQLNELVGRNWADADTMALGKKALVDAFTPIDDVRASAEYRKQMLGNLWHRFWLETHTQDGMIPVRVDSVLEGAAHA